MKFFHIAMIIILSTLISCSGSDEKKADTTNWQHKVTVKEVIQVGSYTYLSVSENGAPYWIAVPPMEAKVDDILYYNSGLEMANFKSTELNRTFEKVLLVQVISDGKTDINAKREQKQSIASNTKGKMVEFVGDDQKESLGKVSLSELFNNRSRYENKIITVSGTVVKVNNSIMNRNWIHITDNDKVYDLAITTQDIVNIGQEVSFEGEIALEKDFTAGYKFEVIMEKATLK